MNIDYCELDDMKCIRLSISSDFLLYMTEVDIEFLVDLFDRLLKVKNHLLAYDSNYKITHKYNYHNDKTGEFDFTITFQVPKV